jgi:hypothetical protein
MVSYIQRISPPPHLGRVDAGNRVLVLSGTDSNSLAVAVTTRVLVSDISPESVRAASLLAVRASEETLATKSEISVLGNLPTLGLSVLGKVEALVTIGGVGEDALAHARAVDVGNLGVFAPGVEAEFARFVDVEGHFVLGEASVTSGVLVLELEGKATIGSLESSVVDFLVALMEGNGVVLCYLGSRNHAGGEDSSNEAGEMHFDSLVVK